MVREEKSKVFSEGNQLVCRVYEDEEGNRVMGFLRLNKDGSQDVIALNSHAVLKAENASAYGDPLVGMEFQIKKNQLNISYYGGSSWRWYRNYTFQLSNGDWLLTNVYCRFERLGKGLVETDFTGIIQEYKFDKGISETIEDINGETKKTIVDIDREHINIREFNVYNSL